MNRYFIIFFLIFMKNSRSSEYQNSNQKYQETVTNIQDVDGFGSQFQNIIAAAVFAELNNKKFVYTPFKYMHHNYNKDPYFIEKKEWLINFQNNFEVNYKNSVTIVPDAKNFFDQNVDVCSRTYILKKIKKIFRENKDLTKYFDKNNFNIAIHVRRPNSHDNRVNGTDIKDKIFLDIISTLRTIYIKKKPIFNLYSQGDLKNFEIYKSTDTVLHLNESIEDTFIQLVIADALVISPSSFSYVAGLLSEGKVFYIPFWHNPLPFWVNVNTLLKI